VVITGIGAGRIVISSLGAGGGVSRGGRIGGDGSMIEVSALLAVVLSIIFLWVGWRVRDAWCDSFKTLVCEDVAGVGH
jgi:hypothetical protein